MPRPVHFEFHGDDPVKATEFYSGLFGWKVTQWGDMPYWLYETGEGPGIDGASGPTPEHGQTVVITIGVDDIDAYIAKVADLGGTILTEKMPIPGVGWLVNVRDPNGILFGMMQAVENAGM
jgi:predicted enzyme related to lactoylglutathione lyase